MKIHEYNQMMAYLTRQETPSLPPVASGEQRESFAEGGDPSKQKILKDIKKYVYKKLSKGEVVTLPELNEKFAEGKRREYLYREALGKDYNKITKLQREGVGRVSLEVKDKLYDIIDDVVKGERPLMDLSRNNLNKELPPVSERQLSKYLNEKLARYFCSVWSLFDKNMTYKLSCNDFLILCCFYLFIRLKIYDYS